MEERYTLVGVDGNAFAIMGYVLLAMKDEGFSKEERDEYKKKYLYAIAELENTKKRFANERPNIVKNAKVSVIKSVLDVIDDFERAIKANETVDDIEAVKEGFNNIYKKLNFK